MTDCVFCPDNWDNLDIVERHHGARGNIIVINPLNPVTPGHVLVIHQLHSTDAADGPVIAGDLMRRAALYVRLRDVGDANIITSIGPNATQTVMHTHLHIVPRTPNDHLPLPWTPQHEDFSSGMLNTNLQRNESP